MNYIELRTNNLVVLVGRNEKDMIDWHAMGTNSDLINLNEIKIADVERSTGKVYYLLPISDLDKALSFASNMLENYNIVVNILSEEEALANRQAFLDSLLVE
jgi:hypothetical protein